MTADMTLPSGLSLALRKARSIGVITGAGLSAGSGIPTYRGAGGIYDDPEEGDRTVEALSGPTLARDPDRTWRVIAELARKSARAAPNAGHLAIAEIEKRVERCVLLTQNVDGLHGLAGSRNVIDIHGNVFETLCTGCGRPDRLHDPAAIDRAPRCPACGAVVRPDVVLFEEMLPVRKLERIQAEFIDDVPDVVIAAGTTALFPYIAQPFAHAYATGATTVEVNPEDTTLTRFATFPLRGTAEEILPALASALIVR